MSNQGWGSSPNTPTEPISQKENESQQSPSRPFWKRGWFLVPVAFFVGILVGVTANSDDAQNATPRTVTVTSIVEVPATTIETPETSTPSSATAPSTTAKPPVTKLPVPTFTAGTYQVGVDIKPGSYKTGGSSDGCYYARLSSDNTSDIIANDLSNGPMFVRIRSTDKFIQFTGNCEWKKVS